MAAADAGVELPNFPSIKRRKVVEQAPVQAAAAKLGISVEAFAKRAAERLAEEILREQEISAIGTAIGIRRQG